jgi:flagellum-specific ATP synthase
MNDIAGPTQIQAAQYFRRLVSLYMENRDLILMGGYAPGQDQDLDLAVQLWPQLMAHIQQPFDQSASYADSLKALTDLFNLQAGP